MTERNMSGSVEAGGFELEATTQFKETQNVRGAVGGLDGKWFARGVGRPQAQLDATFKRALVLGHLTLGSACEGL